MRENVLKLLGLVMMISSMLVLSACSSLTRDLLKDPKVEVSSLSLDEVTTSAVSVRLKLNVLNPNPIPLKIGKVTYALNFDGTDVTSGTANQGIDIPANGENIIELPLKFEFNSLGSVIKGLFNSDYTKPYKLTGTAQVGLFSIPFTKEGELKLK